ncbi:MAG: type VI secretion system amidase effector protein Tae4 [Betaproteobacteria bacterium]|nr:type VI secretion system amidase effector protein Tae4 [Betaproteobacteria bacterium]
MSKPNFAILKSNHYSSDGNSQNYKEGKDVYEEIGYDIEELKKQNPEYENTCAVRMSLALIKSGAYFGPPISRLQVKDGTHKGRYIGTGAKTLADELSKSNSFGKPLTGEKAIEATKTKKGVIFFHKLWDSNTGHIDLIEPSDRSQICHSGCYFDANPREIWFWPLD